MATNIEIKKFVQRHHGFVPKDGWIAHVKGVRGLPTRRAANRAGIRRRDERRPGRVPVDTGTASVPAGLGQAALTSIILGVAARGAGTLTSSMPFAYFASTLASSTPSGSSKLRRNAPYTTSRTK